MINVLNMEHTKLISSFISVHICRLEIEDIHRVTVLTADVFCVCTGVLISPQPDQEGNKLQRRKILSFIYPIYNHNWMNISTIYITRLVSNEIF